LYFYRFGGNYIFKGVLIFFEDQTIVLDSELIFVDKLSKGTSAGVAISQE